MTTSLPASHSPAQSGESRAIAVKLWDNLGAVETIWRALEADAVLTPYQSFDWLNLLVAAGGEPDGRIAIATLEHGGKVVGLLPLLIERKLMTKRARMLGTHQANADWMICAEGFRPSVEELSTVFRQVSHQVGGIDLMSFENQPARWAGMDNPLLQFPHALSPSNLYTKDISGAALPYVENGVSSKHRASLRRARRQLETALGPVRLITVRDEATLETIHAAFIEQRSARFAVKGIDNIFARAPFVELFKKATLSSFGAARPTLWVHALMVGDEVIATSWGTTAGNHYSQYINSTSSGEAGRFRLMPMLVTDLMDELLAAKITSFDMGLGDFEYKREWTKPEQVFNSLIPLTLQGRLFATLLRLRDSVKRTIKQTPILWDVARNVRLAIFRLRGGGKEQ